MSSPVDWRWAQRKRQPDSYCRVLQAFLDRKDSCYSIHQIGGGRGTLGTGLQGASVGRAGASVRLSARAPVLSAWRW